MWIAEAGVYHYKARAYDPNLRRFLQADPIGYAAGMNIYAYVGGDPMNFVDPSGLRSRTNDCPPGTPRGTGCGTRSDRLPATGGVVIFLPGGTRFGSGFSFAYVPVDLRRLGEHALSVANKADEKLCTISKAVAERAELLPGTGIQNPIDDARATGGYSIDVTATGAYIVGGTVGVGIWGDEGAYGYTISVGVVAGMGGSISTGLSSNLNYDDGAHGFMAFTGMSGGFLGVGGFEVGGGTQYAYGEANIGFGTPVAGYVGGKYVFSRTCGKTES